MSSRVVDIKNYWSPVVAETLEFKVIADAENPEFNYLWEKIYGLVDEYFVKTATEYGVSRMEKILKIYPSVNESLEQRKDRLIWKMNLKLPYTMRFLKNILTSMFGEDNQEVEFDSDTNVLTIKILKGLTNPYQLKKDLEKIIPQNLVLKVTGCFNIDSFIITGEPTITENGIASDFSVNDYLSVEYRLTAGKTYEFNISFVGEENNSDSSAWIISIPFTGSGADNQNLRIMQGYGDNVIRFALGGSDLDVYTNTIIHSGENYNFKVVTDFTTFVDFTDLNSGEVTSNKYSYEATSGNYIIRLGTNYTRKKPFVGFIDLKKFSITEDGQQIFSGVY